MKNDGLGMHLGCAMQSSRRGVQRCRKGVASRLKIYNILHTFDIGKVNTCLDGYYICICFSNLHDILIIFNDTLCSFVALTVL